MRKTYFNEIKGKGNGIDYMRLLYPIASCAFVVEIKKFHKRLLPH